MSTEFSPVTRQSVSDVVFGELRDAIVSGRLEVGDALSPERELAESFAVNRHAVREAVKRLQQAGFVRVSHGDGTHVLDVRRSAGLDLLVDLTRGESRPGDRLLRDGLEMRRCIGIEAARLAARRGEPAARQRVVDATTAYAVDGAGADRMFWQAVVEASANLAFRLALNSLLHAIDAQPGVMDTLLAADRADVLPHAELAQAILAADEGRAAELAGAILGQALGILESASGEPVPARV